MKIKVLTRVESEFTRERPQDLVRQQHNPSPTLHPFERAREYTKALNAVKLNRVFAKPFVGALDGHRDGVYALARHPSRLALIASGSADGGTNIILVL